MPSPLLCDIGFVEVALPSSCTSDHGLFDAHLVEKGELCNTYNVSELVRLQVRRELGCFLDCLEKLGENLGESLDNFVLQVKNERNRLAEPSPKDEEVGTHVHSQSVGTDDAPAHRAENGTVRHAALSTPAFDIETSDAIDFSLPPLLDGEHEVVVELTCSMKQLQVTFDGTSERLFGRMSYVADWPDSRLAPGAQLPGNLWTPLSIEKQNFAVYALPDTRVSTEAAHMVGPFVLSDSIQSQRDNGPWLRQCLTELAIDIPLEDPTRLQKFPHDSVKLDFLCCCWHVLEANLQQCIRLKPSSLATEHPFNIRGSRESAEWHVVPATVSIASHTSPKGVTYSDYVVSLSLTRSSHYFKWKVGVPLLMSVLMACFLLVVSVEKVDGISTRLQGSAATLFVIFSIQHTVTGRLPRTPVLTLIDKTANVAISSVIFVASYSAAAHCFWRLRHGAVLGRTNVAMIEQSRMMVSIADSFIGTVVLLYFVFYASWKLYKSRREQDTPDDTCNLFGIPLVVHSTTFAKRPSVLTTLCR